MHTAYQRVGEIRGGTLALMARRERGVWSSQETNTDILAIAKGRFKAPPDGASVTARRPDLTLGDGH